jgi:endonuclease
MASPNPARGIIVAKEITDDLKLAATRIPDVQLIEYELSFKLKPI